MSNTTPLAIECRFATYFKSNENKENDAHFIKEAVHLPDGTIKPNLRHVPNFKRNFYITKKGNQNYKSKREWQSIDELDKFSCTQSGLQWAVAKALNKTWFKGNLRDLQDSPYLYGTDISSTAIIKQAYKDKYNTITHYTKAMFDTETDVINGTEEIIMATVSYKDRLICAINKNFVSGYSDAVNRIHKLTELYLGEIFKTRNIKAEIVLVDSEIDIIKLTIGRAHEWMPDFLAVWNILFDMDKIIKACERAKVDIADIMSDPSVPPEYRSFRFKVGTAKKTTASGVVMSYKPPDRWHTVFAPSSFYWIDAMCTYKKVRAGKAEEKSYSLDAILKKEKISDGKLKFKEADHLTGLQWHQFMQKHYPLEYAVYNMFDCISMEMLDEKTLDLAVSLPMFSNSSDFSNFNSQPKRLADEMHHFCLKNNRVIGCTSAEMKDEDDSTTVGLSDWIN